MIKLKRLLEYNGNGAPDPSLAEWILSNRVVTISEWLYHGTPLDGLKAMLENGIYGTQHGEVAEYDSFSTSVNSEMLRHFSEGHGETGLQFDVKDAKIVILDDMLAYLVTQLPGSGLSLEVDDPDEFAEFVRKFKIPVGAYKNEPYLPYDYLSSLGVDGFMYDYVYKAIKHGRATGMRDESEICFIGKGLQKLNQSIAGIWVDGNEYAPNQKEGALRDIEDRI